MRRVSVTVAAWATIVIVTVAFHAGCRSKKAKQPSGERWRQIQEWAKPTVAPGDSTLIDRAIELIAPHGDALDDQWLERDQLPLTEDQRRAKIPADVIEGVEALIAWYDAQDGMTLADCSLEGMDANAKLLDLVHVGRAGVLYALSDPDGKAVPAVLYLGHRLRSEGRNLLQTTIGAGVTSIALEWAKDHPRVWHEAFETYRPSDDFVLRSLAVEALCQEELISILRESPEEFANQQGGILGPMKNIFTDDKSFTEREIAAVNMFNEETTFGARSRLNDDAKITEYLVERGEEARKHKSMLVQVVAGSVGDAMSRLIEYRTEYREFLRTRMRPVKGAR